MDKLIDILARDLKVWPENSLADIAASFIAQDGDGMIVTLDPEENPDASHFFCGAWDRSYWTGSDLIFEVADDFETAIITRAEWQAAVDALNQSELDAVLAKNEQLAAARAERIQAWNGEGLPPVGTICEVLWNESRMEYLITKVFGVNEHGQPIHRFDEGPKKYQYQADVLRTASGTQVFRPIRTDEQVAAEEREKEINEALSILPGEVRCKAVVGQAVQIMIDAGYRKP